MSNLLMAWGTNIWWLLAVPSVFWGWREFLSDPKWAAIIRTWLRNEGWSDAYGSTLRLLSTRLDALFGPNPWGLRAFGVCYIFAIVYAVLWFFLSLYLSSGGYVSGRSIAIGFALALPLGGLVWWLSRLTRERHAAATPAGPGEAGPGEAGPGEAGPGEERAPGMREYVSYFCIGAASGAGPALFSFVDGHSAAVAGAIAGGCAIAGASLLAGARAGMSAGAGLVASVVLGMNSVLIVLFPLINALFDLVSWAVSRWFLGRLGEDAAEPVLWRRWAMLAFHILADTGFALLALTGLAVCLAIMGDGSPWSLTPLYTAPFSAEGSGLSVMLLSTLLPTALHLFCAVFAILPALPFGHRWIAGWIPDRDDFDDFGKGDRMIVATWLTVWSVVSMVIVWLLFLGGTWLLDAVWATDPQGRNFWQVMLDLAHGIQQWTGIKLN